MSASATRNQGTPTIPNVETAAPILYGHNNNSNMLNTFNHNWQGWGSRPVSPLSAIQTPSGSDKSSTPDTVITVTDDGWRTVTQGSPLRPHIDATRPTTDPALLTHAPTAAGLYVEKPSVVLPPPWLSQPPRNANFSVHPDANFQHTLPSGGEIFLYHPFPPVGLLSRPQEFYQAPPPYLVLPENKFLSPVPIPQPQAMRPSPFPGVPGHCNTTYSRGFQTNYSTPPLVPFTDHSFGFEPPRNHLMPPQFPIPPNQMHTGSPPNFFFSIPMPDLPDSRGMPLMPFDYASSRPPQYFVLSPPQVQVPPPHGPPINSVPRMNDMGNNFVSEGFRELPFANSYSSGLSPRHSRHSRNPQIRQPRSSSSSSPHSVNRNGCRANQPLSARSFVMEEFRSSNKDKHWTLQDIFGHIVEFSGDQNGSRLIQQQLEEASEEDRERVFQEIVPSHTSQLIQDVFGNYVVQKFFDLGTGSQKDIISLDIENNVINYSVHIYACRVVQKAFDYMSEEQQDRVVDRLAGNLLTCIKDQHGNHVIQKLIDTVAPERLTFLRIICVNIPDLASSSTGCRVLQRCLSKLPRTQAQQVLDAIDRHCDSLMKDQYGNYVIQYIVQHGDDEAKARIVAKIRGSMVKLAKNQYASHVCEKAITHSNAQNRSLLIGEILTDAEDGHPIPSMMQDDFANYVLQRALCMAEGEQRVVLFHQAKAFLAPLQKSTQTYSKQLVKIERLVDRYFGKVEKMDGRLSI